MASPEELLREWIATPLPTLLVAAHPDDETVGAGGQLARLPSLTLMHLTDGAPRDLKFARKAGVATREEYAALRQRELDAALRVGDAAGAERIALGFVDQEAALHLREAIAKVTETIARVRPAVVLTHPYEGGHPDHDAAAFVVAVAVARAEPRPACFEMAYYNAEGDGAFLRAPAVAETVVPLSDVARARKQAMMAAFPSQAHVLSRFSADAERFRVPPRYDFSAAPHDGRLYYEKHGWPLDGAQFRRLCALARD
jgi:N-acetylglucosamine malate deacetylase 2